MKALIYSQTTFKLHKKKKYCSVRLEYDEFNWHMFYCADCRNPVMQYKGEIIEIIPGLEESHLPFIVMCSNVNCQKLYNFIWVLKSEL